MGIDAMKNVTDGKRKILSKSSSREEAEKIIQEEDALKNTKKKTEKKENETIKKDRNISNFCSRAHFAGCQKAAKDIFDKVMDHNAEDKDSAVASASIVAQAALLVMNNANN